MTTTHPSPVLPVAQPRPRSIVRIFASFARILQGLIFFVLGLNGFFNFIPPPSKPMAEPAMAFINALIATGYMLPLIAGTQVVAGALLLINRFVPLALVILAPMIVNIVAIHLFLEPSGLAIAALVLVLEVILVWIHRSAFRALLTPRHAI